ncbi:Ku protein [Aquabacter spiritensis]|uniref:Non-homologous end joining protein Ku n=1 Tax=Aquabacter spiritensis TaxID=933073 RepID=A0A4R3M601_9HYPH|nr:Ku protein [Aquabacter spiritensis]TCT06675.1 DNA end-binding protein Ku [Aquabacter spiritensis]
MAARSKEKRAKTHTGAGAGRGAYWKGFLKLSLVTCPVSLTPATTESGKVRFHTLNRATGNRVRASYYDPESGEAVEEEDLRPGFERGADDYIAFEDEELEAVALDSTRTIDIERFVAAASVPWLWYDKPHFLAPDGAVGAEAFAVIRAAMEKTGTAGFARLVLYRREHPVLVTPRGKGMLLWTLRYGEEVRAPDGLYPASDDGKADPKVAKLIERLIDARTVKWDAALFADPVQEEVRALIARKQKGGRPRRAARSEDKAQDAPGNVVDITEALRRSLAAEKPGGRRGKS